MARRGDFFSPRLVARAVRCDNAASFAAPPRVSVQHDTQNEPVVLKLDLERVERAKGLRVCVCLVFISYLTATWTTTKPE